MEILKLKGPWQRIGKTKRFVAHLTKEDVSPYEIERLGRISIISYYKGKHQRGNPFKVHIGSCEGYARYAPVDEFDLLIDMNIEEDVIDEILVRMDLEHKYIIRTGSVARDLDTGADESKILRSFKIEVCHEKYRWGKPTILIVDDIVAYFRKKKPEGMTLPDGRAIYKLHTKWSDECGYLVGGQYIKNMDGVCELIEKVS